MSTEPVIKKTKMANSLEQLKKLTIIVADSGDFEGEFHFIWRSQSRSPRVIGFISHSSTSYSQEKPSAIEKFAQGDLTSG